MLVGCNQSFSRVALVGLQEGMGPARTLPAASLACVSLVTASMAAQNARGCPDELWTYEQVRCAWCVCVRLAAYGVHGSPECTRVPS